MASTDARPIPQKNVAYRATFPIFDADGDLVTGATGLDSEISKDGGTFTDCTNEATEIATSSGMYFLDLTSTEMNADTVAVIVKTTSVGAKTTPLVFYPEEAGDVRVNVTQVNGTNQTAGDLAALVTAVDDLLDTEVAAIKTDTAAIKTKTDNLPAASAATADIPTAGVVADAVWDEARSGHVAAGTWGLALNDLVDLGVVVLENTDKTGYALSSAGANSAADALLDRAAGVETGVTLRQALRGVISVLFGKASGMGGTAAVFRDTGDTKDRITATVDADGNRSAVTKDLT